MEEKAASIDNDIEILYALAVLSKQKGNDARAKEVAEMALAKFPENGDPLLKNSLNALMNSLKINSFQELKN